MSRSMASGPQNPNWRGGRSLASNGYMLVRVGTDHHLADVRGYAYEHRVVAEQSIGRRLQPGEQVHHRNGNKTDNRPENLLVTRDIAHHRVHHRTVGHDRRLPGEDNPTVLCLCGCGESFKRYDESGRPREYVSGHNPMASPTADAVIAALADGPLSRSDIAKATGLSAHAVGVCLSKLKRYGRAINVFHGVWDLTYGERNGQ